MKLTSVVLLSAIGMLTTSLAVWKATPAGGATAEPIASAAPATGDLSPDPVTPEAFRGSGALSVEGRLGHARLAADNPGSTFLLVTARPQTSSTKSTTGVNLAIVIDRSGSMKGRRIEHATAAARGMIGRLRDGDAVTVVAYDTQSETLVPTTTLDSLSRSRVLSALSSITPRGDTCISCGIEAGMQALTARSGMINRILLLSDGEATAGVRDLEGFRRLAERARGMSVPISSIGVDVEYNERVLSALALDSNGRHHFAESEIELGRAFDAELSTLLDTVAKDAEVELDLSPGVSLRRVLDRSFRREGNRIIVPLGTFSQSEEKTLLVELEIPRGAEGKRPVAKVHMHYSDLTTGGPADAHGQLALELTADRARVSELDPFVAERIGRSTTADALTEANELYKAGDIEGAKKKLAIAQKDLSDRKAAAAKSTPVAKKPALDSSFNKQEKALESAGTGFDQPAPPGQAPADTREGKAKVKRNAEVANPFRL